MHYYMQLLTTPLISAIQVSAAPKGMVFQLLWSEIGYLNFDHFCLKQGMVCALQSCQVGSYSVFMMAHYATCFVVWSFKLETLYSFVSYLIKAYRHCLNVGLTQGTDYKAGLKQGIKFLIRSEIWLGKITDFGFQEACRTPPPNFSGSTPLFGGWGGDSAIQILNNLGQVLKVFILEGVDCRVYRVFFFSCRYI